MQKYDFTAPASGASQTVNAPGRYVKYSVGNASGNDTGLIITPGSKPGSKILLYPGQSFTLPESVAQPNGWTIANATGQANIAGTLIIGEGRLDDNTLSGVVSVVDGGKYRTLANNSFAIGAGAPGQGASNYVIGQLWMPPGSGVRAVVESISVRADVTAISGNIVFSNTALASPIQTTNGNSKLAGGASAQAQIKIAASTVNNQPAQQLFGFSVQAGGFQNMYDVEPIVVLPGWGLNINCVTLNATMVVNVQWYEEPNV